MKDKEYMNKKELYYVIALILNVILITLILWGLFCPSVQKLLKIFAPIYIGYIFIPKVWDFFKKRKK